MGAQRVLITGGSGYLGAHVAHRLLEDDAWRVRVLDVATEGINVLPAETEKIEGDVRVPATVSQAVDGVDVVVHAAYAEPSRGEPDLTTVNVGGTRNVLEAALANGARRAILISSTIVHRSLRGHPVAGAGQAKLVAYANAKREAERVANEFTERGLPTAIVRPKTFIGPGFVRAFALMFDWVRSGSTVAVLGSGLNRHQLLHVGDLAEAIRLLCSTDASGVFEFGAKEFGTVRSDLQGLIEHAGTDASLRFVPSFFGRAALTAVELVGATPPSEWHYSTAYGLDSVVDIGRAERELDWSPQHSNIAALSDAYDWHVATGGQRIVRPPLIHRIGAIVARAGRGRAGSGSR